MVPGVLWTVGNLNNGAQATITVREFRGFTKRVRESRFELIAAGERGDQRSICLDDGPTDSERIRTAIPVGSQKLGTLS